MSRQNWFDFIVGTIALLFAFATLWIWRSVFVSFPEDTVTDIPLTNIDVPLSLDGVTGTVEKTVEKNNISVSTTLATTSTTRFVTNSPVTTTQKISTTTVNAGTTTINSVLSGSFDLTAKDINLNVPFTSQAPEAHWVLPWEDACEEASALMLDAYYRGYGLSPLSAKDELQKVLDWETAQGWEGSIDIAHIKILLHDYFKIKRPIKIIENPSVAQIKKMLSAGHPVLIVADGKSLPNKFYSNGGPVYHALIIRGFTADKFITNDPGVNHGRDFVFPVSDVMSAIHDWNGGDVVHGRKVVLVVE